MVALALVLVALPSLSTPAIGSAGPRASSAGRCDPIDPTACLLPFPNDFFTVRDPTTRTGRRVHLSRMAMPKNAQGTPIDPTEWNRNDGFSPGSEILAHVPGVDLAITGTAPITDIDRSLRRDAPIVVLNTRTLSRHPYWAELDANAADEARRALIVRPAANLDEGTRYIVALRRMRDAHGVIIPPPPAFADFLRGHGDGARRAHMHRIFATLARAGVNQRNLYLAWDFTVASARNLTERMLHIRDAAFRTLHGSAPRFTVTGVEQPTPAEDGRIARRVTGTFEVPSYLDQPGGPAGSRFHYSRRHRDRPTRIAGNTQIARFVCDIPRSATTAHPAHPSLYGHGLFGNATEVAASNVEDMADEHDFVFCATDWLGLSDATADVVEAARVFGDFSRFPELADRLQQSMLDALFLGRLLIHPEGLSSDPAFRSGNEPLVDIGAGLVYDGNSLGGIMGGALTAVAQDFRLAVLGVPGMNFSTLLNRSLDFPIGLLDATYPDKLDQQIVLSLVQMLWDRAEADGYAQHMTTDPLPRTPPHRVLMHVAFGDQQVANVASEVEARTIGASIRDPILASSRSPDRHVAWGIPRIGSYPFAGSAMVLWDSASPPPPTTNTAPSAGIDPHEDPRATPAARLQKAVFLTTGRVVDVCGSRPCTIPHAGVGDHP